MIGRGTEAARGPPVAVIVAVVPEVAARPAVAAALPVPVAAVIVPTLVAPIVVAAPIPAVAVAPALPVAPVVNPALPAATILVALLLGRQCLRRRGSLRCAASLPVAPIAAIRALAMGTRLLPRDLIGEGGGTAALRASLRRLSAQLCLGALLHIPPHAGLADILTMFGAASAIMIAIGLGDGGVGGQGQGGDGNQQMAHVILRKAVAL